MNEYIGIEWIPTKERLPEESDSYLITLRTKPNDLVVIEAVFCPSCNYLWGYIPAHWTDTSGEFNYTFDEVLAWAHMPKPYKEDI